MQYLNDVVRGIERSYLDCSIDQLSRTVHSRTIRTKNLTVHKSNGRKISLLKKAASLSLYKQPTVVICGHVNLLPIALIASLIARCPLILFGYGIDVWSRPTRVQQWLMRKVGRVIAISRYTRDQISERYAIPRSAIGLLPNCVSVPTDVTSVCANAYREQLGLGQRKVVLTVSRLSEKERYKGHDRVLHTLAKLNRTRKDLVYLVVGDGDDIGRLRRLTEELELTGVVVFTGRVSVQDRATAYTVADCFVMPSEAEGFGFVFLEARSYGLPVVASDAAGARDALVDGELGALVRSDDCSALASAIAHAIDTPKSEYLGLDRFSHAKFSDHLSRLLNDCVAGNAPALTS